MKRIHVFGKNFKIFIAMKTIQFVYVILHWNSSGAKNRPAHQQGATDVIGVKLRVRRTPCFNEGDALMLQFAQMSQNAVTVVMGGSTRSSMEGRLGYCRLPGDCVHASKTLSPYGRWSRERWRRTAASATKVGFAGASPREYRWTPGGNQSLVLSFKLKWSGGYSSIIIVGISAALPS